jgi:amidase
VWAVRARVQCMQQPSIDTPFPNAVMPFSENQDTVCPMAQSVADAALILPAIAGRDPLDKFTFAALTRLQDFSKGLRKGVRLVVPRLFLSSDLNTDQAFNAPLLTLTKLGDTIVDPAESPDANELLASTNESIDLSADFKVLYTSRRRTPLVDENLARLT